MRPDDLLAAVIAGLLKRNAFAPQDIEDVVVGCANQAGEDSRCVARHAALLAGLPIEIAGLTVNSAIAAAASRAVLDAARCDYARRG